jgi:hypothetical protein
MAITIPQKFNIFRYHQNLICGYIMMSRIDSRHWKISTGRHFIFYADGLGYPCAHLQQCTKFHELLINHVGEFAMTKCILNCLKISKSKEA